MAAKGCKKNGGRQKGTPNKRAEFSVAERLKEKGYEVVGKILDDIEEITDPRARVKFHLQLLEYCDAKRKAIEITDHSMPEPVVIVRTSGETVTLGVKE